VNIHPDFSRPEPFATIVDLIHEHSFQEVLECLSEYAEFDSENEDVTDDFRDFAHKLHAALESVIEEHFEQ
jgi:hypothetical protein